MSISLPTTLCQIQERTVKQVDALFQHTSVASCEIVCHISGEPTFLQPKVAQ